MARSRFSIAAQRLAVLGLMLAAAPDAAARGWGGSGFAHRGFGHGHAGIVRFGPGRGFHGRIGRFAGAGYPLAGIGYAGPQAYPAAPAPVAGPAFGPSELYTRAVIIRRGPAFGEPGYYAHPVIYRLVPAPSRPGVRRFKVERLAF